MKIKNSLKTKEEHTKIDPEKYFFKKRLSLMSD
jgi:hypothetical protein